MHLEHVNLTVTDLERSIQFYQELLGLSVRWRGHNSSDEPSAHLGTEDWYLALFQATSAHRDERAQSPDYDRPGVNHFGVVVDDLDAARERVLGLGAHIHFEPDYEPGRRLYFFDPDGHEVELVTYAAAPAGA